MLFIYFSQAVSPLCTALRLTFPALPAILTIKKGDIPMTGRINYVTAEQAVRTVRDGDYIDYGFGGSFPELLDAALAARCGTVRNVTVRGGLFNTPQNSVLAA